MLQPLFVFGFRFAAQQQIQKNNIASSDPRLVKK